MAVLSSFSNKKGKLSRRLRICGCTIVLSQVAMNFSLRALRCVCIYILELGTILIHLEMRPKPEVENGQTKGDAICLIFIFG